MKKLLFLYKRYLREVLRQKWKYLGSWIAVISLLSLNNLSVFIIGSLIDKVNRDEEQLYYILGLIALTLALPLIFEPLTFHLKTRVLSRTVNSTTSQVYNNVLNLDYNFHVNKQTGKLISIIINSQDVISMFLWQLEWFVIEHFAALVIPIILIGIISPKIALILVAILIFFTPIILWSLKINVKRRKILKDADYDKNTAIVDGISNFETVRSFGTEIRETAILKERLNICEVAMNKYQNSFRLLDFTSRLIGIIMFLAASAITAYYYNNDVLTLGSVVVIVSYLIQMTGRLMSMVFAFRDVIKNLPVAEDFYELMDTEYEIHQSDNPHYLHEPKGEILFENVTFGYGKDTTLLQDLNLEINSCQNIALVGPSGGGKSTITRLLMRYYDVNEGTISIDGINVKNLALDNLRDLIGIVPQEPVLFNRSILYNVGYAMENIDDESEEYKNIIIEACKRAHIHEFIEELPNGYSTFVGERGVKLSGGQKQRLAIARVLIKDPKIVVFDEATSMLDSESEKAIQKAFKELSKDKTTIVIAHRLSTIINCDKIFLIDKGKVVETGTHPELIKNGKIYSKLWEIQSGGFIQG